MSPQPPAHFPPSPPVLITLTSSFAALLFPLLFFLALAEINRRYLTLMQEHNVPCSVEATFVSATGLSAAGNCAALSCKAAWRCSCCRKGSEGDLVSWGNEKNVLFWWVTHALACMINYAISRRNQFQAIWIRQNLDLAFAVCDSIFYGFAWRVEMKLILNDPNILLHDECNSMRWNASWKTLLDIADFMIEILRLQLWDYAIKIGWKVQIRCLSLAEKWLTVPSEIARCIWEVTVKCDLSIWAL